MAAHFQNAEFKKGMTCLLLNFVFLYFDAIFSTSKKRYVYICHRKVMISVVMFNGRETKICKSVFFSCHAYYLKVRRFFS